MKKVGTVKNGCNDITEILNLIMVHTRYGLTIKNAQVKEGVFKKGDYVVEAILDEIPYTVITEEVLEGWVNKYVEHCYDFMSDRTAERIEALMSSLKPKFSLEEYYSTEELQHALDLFIESVSSNFEQVYLKYFPSTDELCIWFVDMEKY